MSWRQWLLLGVVATITFIVFLFPPIPQSEAYHHFADTRARLNRGHRVSTRHTALPC
jgi:hypothetical protein